MAVQLSGVITVAAAGTAVAGPAVSGSFMLRADPANTSDYVYIGNDGAGDVASTNGYKLGKNDGAVILNVRSMANVFFDAGTNGDKILWLRIDGGSDRFPADGL